MSYQPPLPPGPAPGPHASYGPPTQGAAPQFGGHPAYIGYPSPTPQSSGLNPWAAASLGALGGALVTAVIGALLWFMMGGPVPWESMEDVAADWSGSVDVASNGSVAGPVLADAVFEVGGGGFYEEVDCPATARVATDLTTVCRVNDGFDTYRVVVLFLDDRGSFEMAEIFSD